MKKKMTVLVAAFVCGLCAFADITVSDVQVFSGYPWKEVVVGYTITGTYDETLAVRLTAEDRAANKIYDAKTLIGAEVTEGRHIMRWNAAADGARFSSTRVVFTVSIVFPHEVQLWENGPYWAKCNVGATRPEDFGYYFWWGDTGGYKRNAANDGWISVKDGSEFSFSEANCPTCGKMDSQLRWDGYIDSTGILMAAHDAATAHLGTPWRMPTDAEFVALTNNCDTSWTMRSGVWGRLVTGRGAFASKSIFLPAAGVGSGSNLNSPSTPTSHYYQPIGNYWSSTMSPSFFDDYWQTIRYCAWGFCCRHDRVFRYGYCDRYIGMPIRPIRESAQ